VKFIHAADLHLDSQMIGLGRYDDAPLERLRNSTRESFLALVQLALDEQVDLLLIAGDVYDGDWKDFNTGLFFRQQLTRLTQAGILVFIIHGNHDASSIISKELPGVEGVHVLDTRACQSIQLPELGVVIHGQGFATRKVTDDLAAGYPPAVPGLFNIGMLHTSLTGRPGHAAYAPTSVDTLVSKGYDYLALGHVHTREIVREAAPRIVFPGNLQGRNARETGPRGCDLVTVTDGRIADTRFVELDVVRWHQLKLDTTGIETLEALSRCFADAVREAIPEIDDRLHALRVSIAGESSLFEQESLQPGTLSATLQAAVQDIPDIDIWLEKVLVRLSSPLDRDSLKTRGDALGEIVRHVDTLLADDVLLTAWFRQAMQDLKSLPDGVSGKADGDEPAEDPMHFSAQQIRDALLGAEATVLARLVTTSQGDNAR
jgi:DNA repair exonuclease SbcCD nuclease subunit